jgi:hypothetical protein
LTVLIASDLDDSSILVNSRSFFARDRLLSLLRTTVVALKVSLLVIVVTSNVRLIALLLHVE